MKIRDNTTVTVTITVTSGPSWNVTTLAGATRARTGSMSVKDINELVSDLVTTSKWDVAQVLDRVYDTDEQTEIENREEKESE